MVPVRAAVQPEWYLRGDCPYPEGFGIRSVDMDGPFDTRYLAFLETIAHTRARLHRYCARMTGSVTDGEDVVQNALFQAYRRLDTFEDGRPLTPWLFRIAHNQCIDFLRKRGVQEEAESAAAQPDFVEAYEPPGPALELLVLNLPPKERACVLLKDVFDFSLEEIAGLVDSTVGGVKAALNRGRSKLAPGRKPQKTASADPAISKLLGLYVERFNRRDWDGVRELISADARLSVADRFSGRLADSPYFGNYERRGSAWELRVGDVEGAPILLFLEGASREPAGIVRVEVADGRIIGISDYQHCPWVVQAAVSFPYRAS